MPRVHHIAALLFAVTAAAWAQQAPQKLDPLPEPPPPPQGMELDNEVEQQVTIGKKGEDTVEEFRPPRRPGQRSPRAQVGDQALVMPAPRFRASAPDA